jgi:hypothetical protein
MEIQAFESSSTPTSLANTTSILSSFGNLIHLDISWDFCDTSQAYAHKYLAVPGARISQLIPPDQASKTERTPMTFGTRLSHNRP